MKIYYNDTYEEVIPSDSSYRLQEVMGDNMVSLEFRLTKFIDFPIGSYIVYQERQFVMYEIGQFTKVSDREYSYVLAFHTAQKQLERYKFRNHVDRRLKFTLTAKPKEFIEHICINLTERTGIEWHVGDCLECSEKTQSFCHNSILDALNSVASLFETEWEIRDTTINLRKVEYNKENPLPLSYGKGNGFRSGIQRVMSGETAVDVLFCEGGNRNIDQSKYVYYKKDINGIEQKYHADTLRLPKSEKFFYIPPTESLIETPDNKDYGTIITLDDFKKKAKEERDKIAASAQCYTTDSDGFELRRAMYNGTDFVENFINNGYEESADFTEIYPKRVGTISEVITIDKDKHFYNFRDEACDVDYSDKSTWESGAKVTCIFEDGMLEGKEFNISKYTHILDGDPVHEFEIQPAEIDAITMPDEETNYMPRVGEKYAIFHVNLPEKYITSAEREMALQGCYWLYNHTETEIEFQGEIDGIWAKKQWAEIAPKIGLGYYVNFTDNAICQDGKKMRIIAVKDSINRPHSPELTLSNTTIAQGISAELKKIPQNQVYATHEADNVVNFAKRNFRDTEEMLNALNIAFQGQYQDGINPATVRTMGLMIGDASLQYEFGIVEEIDEEDYVTQFSTYLFEPIWSAEDNSLIVGIDREMRHLCYTYSVTDNQQILTLVPPYWQIRGAGEGEKIDRFTIAEDEADTLFYLYVKVSKNALLEGNVGKVDDSGNCFLLSKQALQSESAEWLYLLVGILNREYNGTRSFASVFGKTEITGNRITTSVIKSQDGSSYFDLDNNIIVGKFNFKQGLISSQILVGNTEASATSGLGGNYLIWAGNAAGGKKIFSVNQDGRLVMCDTNGNTYFAVNPYVNNVYAAMFTTDEILMSGTCRIIDFNPFGGIRTQITRDGITVGGVNLTQRYEWSRGGGAAYIRAYRIGCIVTIELHSSPENFDSLLPIPSGYRPVEFATMSCIFGTGTDDSRALCINKDGNIYLHNIGNSDVVYGTTTFITSDNQPNL